MSNQRVASPALPPSAMVGLTLLVLVALSVCTPAIPAQAAAPASAPRKTPYTIVTTVGMVTSIVAAVAGEKATVTGIIGEGTDPHLYKPTRNDVLALSGADVIFYNGLLLEGKMADLLERTARSNKPVHSVTEALRQAEGFVLAQRDRHNDPHVWMDVAAWKSAVQIVADGLSDFDPANSTYYAANAAKLSAEMDHLDAYARRVLSSIPAEQRILVTAHDAFNYFGRAYGIEVLGIQGLSTESEAGLQDIERLIDTLVVRRIPAVFVETSVSDKNVHALIEGAKARGHTVKIGGSLFSDAMGAPGTYEGTYIGMIDHNVTTIARALGGDAPAGGLNGLLGKSQ